MTKFQCKGCGGVYTDTQGDGTNYFHACPDGITKADRRDENVKSPDAKDAATIKSVGKGVVAQ